MPKKFKNNRKFKYISNCPDINSWQEGIDYKNKDSFQIHDNKDQIKIGFIGLIRDKEHVENIKNISANKNFFVFQAGTGDYLNDVQNLSKNNFNIYSHGLYDQKQLYQSILSNIDVMCVFILI